MVELAVDESTLAPQVSPSQKPGQPIAAIDLGSNSFHMVVARVVDGHIVVVDRMKEMVQLGAGLDGNRKIRADAEQRALECLGRFGQRVRDIPQESVRVVGTNTLRV